MEMTKLPYLFDGGASREIEASLTDILELSRNALGVNFAMVTYEPNTGFSGVRALASLSTEQPVFPSPNEPLIFSQPLPNRFAATVTDLEVRSLLRECSIHLSSAVVIPWRDRYGDGALVFGDTFSHRIRLPHAARQSARNVNHAVRAARATGSYQIREGLHSSLKAIAEANATLPSAHDRLQVALEAVSALFGADVAYIGMPDSDPRMFTFSQMLGIHTPAFRRLRMGEGQGLGGLARRTRRPVRSLDYGQDHRLEFAPLKETRDEGIVSAMATPLILGKEVRAVLYIGDRHLHAFSQTDEDVFTEFAGYATLGIEQNMMDIYREQKLRAEERERIAFSLHDSVVRHLVQIGFTAEAMANNAARGVERERATAIGHVSEQAIEALRLHLSELLDQGDGPELTDADGVIAGILELHPTPGFSRSYGSDISAAASLLSRHTAHILTKVGREAVVNAERHSGGDRVHVQVDVDESDVCLLIRDNGVGFGSVTHGSAHFGLKGMRAALLAAGGTLDFLDSGEGLTVKAKLSRLSYAGKT